MGRSWRVGALALLLLAVACGDDDEGGGAIEPPPTTTTTTTVPPFTCDAPAAGSVDLTVGDEQRRYVVAPPASFEEPVPLVVLFHGFLSTAEEIGEVTALASLGPSAGVLVAMPQALGDPTSWRLTNGLDREQAFVDAVLDELRGTGCVDPERVWLAGFSAGSGMSGVYACTRPDAGVTGVVLVSGLPPAICPEERTPRVLVVHGTEDPVVPFGGGAQPVEGDAIELGSVPASTAEWAAKAGCGPEPVEGGLGDDVRLSMWGGCERGGPVELLAVEGGGHSWPGSVRPASVGFTTQTVSVSCLVLALADDPGVALGETAEGCPGEGGT